MNSALREREKQKPQNSSLSDNSQTSTNNEAYHAKGKATVVFTCLLQTISSCFISGCDVSSNACDVGFMGTTAWA